VSTSGGALPEVVEHGVTGIVVPPADSRALAEAMVKLMADPQLRRRMGKAGRQRVLENFSWRKAALGTEAVYRRLRDQALPAGTAAQAVP
jgi:glycosyltransferase involved in cell wall biosynthesis